MDLLTGFLTIGVAIACGVGLAHAGLVDVRSQRTLADVSFFIATPALMLLTISEVQIGAELTANLLTSAGSLILTGGVYAAIARLAWRLEPGRVLIGALTSSYVNAGNLGVAVAAYLVGDIAVVVPTLMVQVLLVQPICLAVLDRRAARHGSGSNPWRRLLTNPLTLCSGVGLGLAATGTPVPSMLDAPLRLLAGFAIPAMLIAYGASLRLAPAPGRSGHNREVGLAVPLKLVVQPMTSWALGVALGLESVVLLGVVMTAALPTAQNIFLHATRYRLAEAMARETILVTTLCCLPVSLVVALLLG